MILEQLAVKCKYTCMNEKNTTLSSCVKIEHMEIGTCLFYNFVVDGLAFRSF